MINKVDKEDILNYCHLWNWYPDWEIVFKLYEYEPDSYSVFTPFAYSYLEELIRSTTHEYGIVASDVKGNIIKKRKVGLGLINLAIEENKDNIDYIKLLEQSKMYFKDSSEFDEGNNRNSTLHGYIHPRFWCKNSFEDLIHFIAQLSEYARF